MKLTKNNLKQLIREELQKTNALFEAAEELNDPTAHWQALKDELVTNKDYAAWSAAYDEKKRVEAADDNTYKQWQAVFKGTKWPIKIWGGSGDTWFEFRSTSGVTTKTLRAPQ
tara:strand:+ start:259 stop:597 length:339 start_codon:yes stop_codon:yes gene_type:complete